MSGELIVVEKLDPVEVFTGGGIDAVLSAIEAKTKEFEPTTETDSGRKKIASMANKVARSKTLLDGIGKEMVADWKAKAKKVDVVRKQARDFLDDLKVQVRRPLTEWEEKDQKRIEALQQSIQEKFIVHDDTEWMTAEQIADIRDAHASIRPKDGEFDELTEEALSVWNAYQGKLLFWEERAQEREEKERLRQEEEQRLAEERRKFEEEQARLAEERRQEEERQRVEREKLEAERREIEEQRRKEDEARRKEQECIEQERRAIEEARRKIDEEKRREQERKDREEFERQAQEDARIRAEQEATEQAEREKREAAEREAAILADKKLQAKQEKKTMAAIRDVLGTAPADSVLKDLVKAIKKGTIPNVMWVTK